MVSQSWGGRMQIDVYKMLIELHNEASRLYARLIAAPSEANFEKWTVANDEFKAALKVAVEDK